MTPLRGIRRGFMSALGATTIWIVALALLWLALAVAMTIVAARRFRLAEDVLGAARANATLLELAPARPLVIRPDQRLEADAQLVRELGLHQQPGRLKELIGGLAGIDRRLKRTSVDADEALRQYLLGLSS